MLIKAKPLNVAALLAMDATDNPVEKMVVCIVESCGVSRDEVLKLPASEFQDLANSIMDDFNKEKKS